MERKGGACVRMRVCVLVCVVHSGPGTGFPALEMANHLFSPYGEAQSAAEGRGGWREGDEDGKERNAQVRDRDNE